MNEQSVRESFMNAKAGKRAKYKKETGGGGEGGKIA